MTIKERKTIVENLTLMAIMGAINALFSLFATWLPVISLFLVIILPFTSVIIALYCKPRYFFIYIVATIGISLLITMYNMQYTIFYLIPAIFTGLASGYLVRIKLHGAIILFLTAALQFLLSYAMIPLIDALYETSLVEQFLTLFNLADKPFIYVIVPAFIFIIAFAQTTFSYIAISSEIKKFNFALITTPLKTYVSDALTLIFLILTLSFAFFCSEASYIFLICSLYFICLTLINLCREKKLWIYLTLGGTFFLFIVLFALFYEMIVPPNQLLVVGILPLLFIFVDLVNILLMHFSNGRKIISEGEMSDD